MVKLVSRSALGFGATGAPSARVRVGVALHYNGGATGLSASASHTKCINYWKSIRSFHRSGNGWTDIGYSWGVCPHGYTFEGRGFDRVQAAQPGGNSSHQSITLMIGGSERPSAAHVAAVKETIAWLRSRGVGNQIRGHRDFYNTSCPGNIIYGMMKDGAFNPGGSWSGNVSGGGGGASNSGVRSTKSIQTVINDLGYTPKLDVDGDYGPKTTEAVRWAQRLFGVDDDGDWGPKTEAAYKAYIAKKGGSKPSSEPSTGEFLTMAKMVWYSNNKGQDFKKGAYGYVRFDNSNEKNPDVTFCFGNKKFVGNAHIYYTGGGRIRVRFVKDKIVNGKRERSYESPWTVLDRHQNSIPLADICYDNERARLEIIPIDNDVKVTFARVTTFQAKR